MKKNLINILFFTLLFSSMIIPLSSQSKNGFDLSDSIININDIHQGGPPRDGIPSISNPEFISVNQVDYLKEDDIIIGVVRGDTVKAYPTRILIWHEIVNDTVEGEPIVVTYCPLCGTSMVFSRSIGGQVREFGVSGLLYQSDVLMYDRESESLWSQLEMKAVSGEETGEVLKWLPSEYMTWKSWRDKYPHGEVLSIQTGYNRNYGGNAYGGYFASDRTMFPVPEYRRELPNKALIIGVIVDGEAIAFPIDQFSSSETYIINIASSRIQISYEKERKHPFVRNGRGETIPYVISFWFAWQAFYPETVLWSPE